MKNEKCLKTTSKKALHRFTALAAVLLAVCLVFMTPAAALTADTGWGTGYDTLTEFSIADAGDLAQFAAMVNGGKDFSGKTVKLTADINLNNEEWTQIGTKDKPFSGIFDGQGHTISNLKVTDENYVGFFGYVKGDVTKLKTSISGVYNTEDNKFTSPKDTYTAKIGNFNLVNVDVSGKEFVGTAVGCAECAYIYGITVGTKDSTVDVIKSVDTGSEKLGGVVGYGLSSFIYGCTNNADITSVPYVDGRGDSYNIGGIVGAMRNSPGYVSIISDCTNNGDITYVLTAGGAGGICGQTSLGKTSGLVIYNCVNNGDITISTTCVENPGKSSAGMASGIIGITNGDTPIILANCINNGEIKTAEGSNTVSSLNGLIGYCGNFKAIDCEVNGKISGDAVDIGGIVGYFFSPAVDNFIKGKGTTVSAAIDNTNNGGATSSYIATIDGSTGNFAVIKDVSFTSAEKFVKALPVSGKVKFESVTVSDDPVTINLKANPMTLDVTGVSPAKFSIDVSSIVGETTTTVILPDDADVELTGTGTASTAATLVLKGTGIKVTNNADLSSITLVIEDADGAKIVNSELGELSYIKVSGSENVEIQNEGKVTKRVIFEKSSNNAVLINYGTIGSTGETDAGNQHTIYTDNSNNLLVHNHGTIQAQPSSGAPGYVIHVSSSTGLVFLNYKDAELISGDDTYIFPELSTAEGSKLFAFANSIKYSDGTYYNFGGAFAYKANNIVALNITQMPYKTEYNVGETFDPTGLVVKANFTTTTGTGYNEVELDNAWLVFENTTIAADKPVTVSFLGSFKTEIRVTVNTPVEPETPEIPDVPETPDVPEVPDNQDRPSSSGTSTGDYQYYPRAVPTDGIVSFGSSKVVKGMELPAGSDGTVTLNTKPTFAMPENGFYAFEIDAPGYNLDAKINGGLSFQIPVADLEAEGFTANDIVLFHGTVAEDGKITWEALPTNLVKVENGIAYYKAAINGCSPFYIGFVEDGSIVNTEVVDPVTPPTETPDVPGTDLPDIPGVQDEPEEPSSPAPILAVLAGLGAAVVLRRK